jgi:hypothetical protein
VRVFVLGLCVRVFVLGLCVRGLFRILVKLGILVNPSSVGCHGGVHLWGSHFSIGKREHKRNRYAEMSGIL